MLIALEKVSIIKFDPIVERYCGFRMRKDLRPFLHDSWNLFLGTKKTLQKVKTKAKRYA